MKRKLSDLNKEEFKQFHENKVHGTALRPFAKYRTVICEKMPSMSAHWHEEMEIIKVQEGTGSICIDDKWFSVHKGDIVFVNPRKIHSIARYKNEDMVLDSIIFNLRILESTNADACSIKYLAPIINGTNLVTRVIRTKFADYHVFDQNMTTIMQAYNDAIPGWEMAVKANLFWLFYHLYRLDLVHRAERIDENRESESVQPAIDYIRENYAEEISIKTLASLCGFSETYFMKRFKKAPGMSCVDYINGVRLNEPYIKGAIQYEMEEITVQPDHVFVLGDNRNDSSDSHDPRIGALPLSMLKGKVHAIVWPLSEISLLPTPEYNDLTA